MNTTFTNYAEKKAKQILNLLQGYTKGIRMTVILVLLLMGVSNAWGASPIYSIGDVYVTGSMNSWSTNSSDWKLGSGNHCTKTFYVKESDTNYTFKLYLKDGYYAVNGYWFTKTTSGPAYSLSTSGNDMQIETKNINAASGYVKLDFDFWGEYSGDSKLSVTQSAVAALSPSLSASSTSLIKSGTSTITASCSGGSGSYTYTYKVTCDGSDVTNSTLNAATGSSVTFTAPSSVTGKKIYTITVTAKDSHALLSGLATKTATKTITVEEAHNVTVSYKYGSTTIKDNTTTNNVKYETASSITAPAIDGYKFANWTLGNGITNKSANTTTNPISITTKSSGTYTLTANYTEDLTSNWKLIGDNQTNSPFGDNYTYSNGKAMTKKSGHSTESNVYITLDIKHLPASYYGFKVATSNSDNDKYGYGTGEGYYITFNRSASNSQKQVYSGSQHELKFIPDALGEYEFRVNYPSNKYVYVTFPTAYTVTFGKGTGGSSVTAKYNSTPFNSGTKVQSGKTVTFTQNASAGYTFKEWNTKSDGTGTKLSTNATYTHTVAATNTVYAIYTPNKYTVKFNANGGTGSMADQDFTYDAEQELTENAFTLENALFVGWATSEENANNGEVAYTDGQSVSNLTTTKDGVVNLYAVWATISITACPERIKLNDQLTLTISYKNIPENYIYRVYITNHNQPVPNNNGEWITISGSGTLTHTSRSGHNFTAGENNIVVELYNQNHTILLLKSEAKTFIAEQIGTIAVYTRKEGEGDVFYTNLQNVSASFGVSITAPTIDGYRFDHWEEISGGIVFTPNTYSSTVTVTASNGGQIRAYYKKLEPKTIYLKTVEGTTDGVKWYVKYNDTEYLMDELGCTNEYYKGVVPEGTSFQFVSRDASTNIVETKGTNLQYVEGKTLYNLVSAAASGNKIFFKPNQKWIDKASKDKLHFAGRFWTGSAVWKQMTDDNGDGIYDCEKPTNGNEVIFCLVNNTDNIENWGDNWNYKQIQTNGDNAYKQIPNGSNLFTITDNNEDQATATWSTHADTPVNGDGEWTTFTGITYRITFDQQEATTAGTTHVDVAYHASMPEIEKLPTRTEKKFGGYYTEANGQGVMLVNAFGEWQDATGYIASGTWEKEECVTLYAYWKDLTQEITDITLSNDGVYEPVAEGGNGDITAQPTIDEHGNQTAFVVCWKLLYNNGREVVGREATPVADTENQVKFSIAGLSTGTYIIRASLYAGDACGTSEELSRYDKKFVIVSTRTVTVNYTCDSHQIMASNKVDAHVINATEITAPDIIGYTFKEWVAGDGVIISTANKASKTIEFTAYYDGYLTATYTKNDNIIYFYNTLGWQNVYVYFYSSDKYWDNSMGSGSKKDKIFTNGDDNDHKPHYREYRGQMTHIAGTQIWYYDCSVHGDEIKGYTNVVFNKYKQDNYEWFNNTEAVRRGDMDADKLPMYVPIKAAAETKNGTNYYNKGYWMNYPENTGYKLQIYDKVGNDAKEVASVRFPYSTNTIMPLTVSVDLEAGKTYGFKILREDNVYFGNDGTITENITNWSFETGKSNCGLQTTLAGDYTFTLKYANHNNNNEDYKYRVDVVYPVSVGDYRVIYKDNAKWSQTAAHGANWYHPSYAIKKNSSNTEGKTDIVSFFIAKDNNPTMKFQKCTAINGQTVTWADNGTITIPNDVVTAAGVYNFIVKQPAGGASISVESVEPYTGNYYIRVDAMDGKWGNYKTDPDNRMTYSAFSESDDNSFGDKFSHYATKWCEAGTNVKFTIANDYSPCVSDTLIRDIGNPFGNIDVHGNLNGDAKYAANIRFMWNRHTNKISRAYVAGATFTDRQFLILKADKEIKNSSGGNLSNEGDNHGAHQAIFEDTQNWIYERTIQVQPGTRVKLYACYPDANVANAQYFRGTYDNNSATWNEGNSVQLIGGQGTDWYTMRIIYDFKTNRLMGAWTPNGQDIDDEQAISADVIVVRDHQEDAQCITFTDDGKLTSVKTVYGVLRLNRWVLNNKSKTGNHEHLALENQKSIYERALYFISFPFDVHLSDVFGFGEYGTHWVISTYNGLRRAQRGFFAEDCINEDCTNWDYIWRPDTFTMKANVGYLLSLDLDLMKDDNIDFWEHNINTVELYFPSVAKIETIERTNYTMPALAEAYKCTINHNTDGSKPDRDRRVKDSYWRCIGVPSFANYDGSLKQDNEQGSDIVWKDNYKWEADESGFPFLYEWNVTDNSLSVQSTNRYTFKSTFAYLVQNGKSIYWSVVNAKPSPIVARQRTDAERNYEWKITLSRNDVAEDQTFLRMTDNEEVTEEFDFNQDLAKELNYGRSDIYTLIGYERAAANSMPFSENTTVVSLGLDIEQAGDYTIAMPEGVENIGITLVDNETGIHTNLSAGQEYTLTLNNGICENRLFIEVSPIQNTPTDLEYTTGDTREQTTRKVLINEKLYIIRDGVVYDAQGHRL